MPRKEASKRTGQNAGGLDRERATVTAMIRIYCRDRHEGGNDLCTECNRLFEYAMSRLDCCPFGAEKPKCAECSIHCYRPEMQAQIRQVMRYAGPRLASSASDLRGSTETRRP